MNYDKKPKMVIFDVGGTLFDDGKCIPVQGLSALRKASLNPEVTSEETLATLWDEYTNEVTSGLKSQGGITLDAPLSATIKYVTMMTGLHFDISMAEQEELFDRYNSTRTVIDGVPELMATLGQLNIRTGVISNNAMNSEGLLLALKRWIPSWEPEFCLTSADILLTKPHRSLFDCASSYSGISPEDCWYCGDGRVPDVDGAVNGGMKPVLLKVKSGVELEYGTDHSHGEYLVVNNWNVLREYILNL